MRLVPLVVHLAPVSLLALAVAVGGRANLEAPAEQPGKARLVETLEAGIREDQKRIDDLRAPLRPGAKEPSPGPGPWALDPVELRRNVLSASLRHRDTLSALLGIVEQEESGRIPARLKSLFLSCGPHGCRDGLTFQETEDFIVAFGAPALQALLGGFGGLDSAKKESVLHLLLRVDPQPCPEAVLKEALLDPVFRVRSAALAACRRNCAPADFQRSLEGLLARETDPDLLLYLLEQASGEAGRNAWRYDELIRLVQSGRIPADKAFGQLCSATVSGEKPDAAVLDVPFWRNVFETHESRRACLVQNLFLRLDQERQLVPLRRLFTEAAGHRYGFGSVRGLYGPASPTPPSYWNSIPAAADQMLALFKAHLGQQAMRAWEKAPETPLGARLLLNQWLGNDPAGRLQGKLRLRIEVRSPAGVVSSGERDVLLGQPFRFSLPPLAPGFQEVDYWGAVFFDSVRLTFGIRDFVVGLQPSGAGFAPVIPVDGRFETRLRSQGKEHLWRISLEPA
jgi:hypothetical protein